MPTENRYSVIIRGSSTAIFSLIVPVPVVVPVITCGAVIFLHDFLGGKRRGPSTVTVAFTINAIAIISIRDTVAVSVIAPPIRRGGPATSRWGPGTSPPAVTVSVTIAVPFMIPIAFIPSARATGAFTFTARRGASLVAPNRRGGIFSPLISRVGLA